MEEIYNFVYIHSSGRIFLFFYQNALIKEGNYNTCIKQLKELILSTKVPLKIPLKNLKQEQGIHCTYKQASVGVYAVLKNAPVTKYTAKCKYRKY